MGLIVTSQSGETSDTLEALRKAKKHGIKTVSITNMPESSMAKEADESIITRCGEEKAILGTKTYVTQLFSLYAIFFNMIKSELSLNNSSRRDLFKSVIEQCNGAISDYFILLNKEDDGIILEESSLEYLKKMELKSAEIGEISENLCIIGKFDLSTQQELIDKSIKRLELMLDNLLKQNHQ